MFTNIRPGSIQIDDVLLTAQPALDILKNSVRPVVLLDGTMAAQFAPIGVNGPVPLDDLAEALGVDHFNWRQTILGYPAGPIRLARFLNVDTNEKLLDLIAQDNNPSAHFIRGDATQAYYTNATPTDFSDDVPVEMVLATTPLSDPISSPTEFYAVYAPDGLWHPVILKGDSDRDRVNDYFYIQDNFPYYHDERDSVTTVPLSGGPTVERTDPWSMRATAMCSWTQARRPPATRWRFTTNQVCLPAVFRAPSRT